MRRRGPSRAAALLNRFLGRTLLRDPREAAVFRFAWRTILRHRNSRLMLAMFGGMALCWTLFSLAEAMRHGAANDAAPSALLLSIPLDFSFLLLLGMRVMFGMPVELPASWAFRIAPLEWASPLSARRANCYFSPDACHWSRCWRPATLHCGVLASPSVTQCSFFWPDG